MANLVDTSVNGDLRVTGKIYGTVNAVTVNTANLAIPPLGNGDNVGSTGDFFVASGSGKNLPDTSNNFNIHTTVTHFTGTTYRLTQIATPTSGSNPAGIYERGASSSDGVAWTFGSWLAAANSSHTHGNIANGGTLTDTAAAAAGNDYVVIRDADNAKIQTSTIKGTDVADAVSKKHSHSTLTLSTTAQAYDGSHTLALPSTDPYTSARTPTSHASSATTYGVGTTANYGHVKLDNSTPLTVGTTSSDGVATGKAHVHNGIESVARDSVTTPDIAHINTNTRVHMVLSQISSASGTTHDPGDGYMLTFMWDTSAPYDSQLFIPGGDDAGHDFGRLRVRYRNNGSWGDWGYLPMAASSTLIDGNTNLDTITGESQGNIIGYYWTSTSCPTNRPDSSNTYGAQMLVFRTASGNWCTQLVFRSSVGVYQRRWQDGTWGSWEKVLVSSDITTGTANGTISVAGSDVAVKGLGGAAYLNTGTASGTVATGNHTHTTSIASDSSSGTVVALAHDTQYKLTAGGTSVLFKTPADSNTDTKVTQTADNSSTGTGFEVLFSATADNTTRTEASRKSNKLTFQPSTGTLTATKFSGPLTGNVTGDCSGSSASCTGNAATATSAGKLTSARKAYVTLGTASTTTTVDWSADPTTIPVDGTLAVSHGGTGMTTSTNVNAVVIGNSTTATNAMQTVRTGNGAFYATAQDAKPQFGTLPAAQGGTGKTSAKDACNAFINALDTGSSTPVDADYYVSQYVSGGTTTTTYHRRPMSALWTYIKGKLTSVSGVNISGNAATATKINTSAKIGDTNKPVYIAADGTVTPISYTIATSVPSGAVFTDTKVTQNLISTSGSYPVILKNSTTATDSPTSTVNYGASITANPGTGQLHATTFDVNSKCTLQFNATTNALDFVFA